MDVCKQDVANSEHLLSRVHIRQSGSQKKKALEKTAPTLFQICFDFCWAVFFLGNIRSPCVHCCCRRRRRRRVLLFFLFVDESGVGANADADCIGIGAQGIQNESLYLLAAYV